MTTRLVKSTLPHVFVGRGVGAGDGSGVTVGAVVVMVLFGSTGLFANIAIITFVFTPLKALVVQDLDALAE